MSTKLFKIAVVTMLAVGVIAGDVRAKNAPQNERTIQGTVSVTKNNDGKIIAVKLMISDKLGYSITLDAKGKELGQKMGGKKVEVIGIVEVKDKVEWLTVKSYSEIVAKPVK
ncbi:MAG: hypothetical protein WAK60_12140 [Sedimentisphaerales bacterium]